MINIFKPYLSAKSSYKGGKGKSEVSTNQKIWKLSSNENLLGPAPMAIQAIQRVMDTVHEYSDYTGDRFRAALQEFYNDHLNESQFVTCNGGTEALDMICRAFLEPDLESIICNPCFGPYALFTKKAGATVIDIPLSSDNYALDVEGIIAAINERTRLIFLANPNNPTGTYIPKSTMDNLLSRIPNHVVVVYDEVYYQFAEASDYTTAIEYVNAGHQVIGINSFSKAYGLGGLRVGYMYSTSEIANYIRQIRRPFMLNSLSLEGAMAALSDREHIQRTVELIKSEKPRLYAAMDVVKMHYWKSEANFILMRPKMNDEIFTQRMLKHGVMVRPVAGFGAPGCVRVTIGTEEANTAFIQALKTIGP